MFVPKGATAENTEEEIAQMLVEQAEMDLDGARYAAARIYKFLQNSRRNRTLV